METNKHRQSIRIAGQPGSRINVLEIIGNASKGGMENYIKNFITYLPFDQFQVTCICPYESRFTALLRKLGVEEVYVTPIADDPQWRSIQLTVEVARLHKIDVLHAHMPKAHVLAGLAGCLLHKPVLATVHGMDITSYELAVARSVGSHLTCNCQEAFAQALALGIPSERITLVRNGVDISAFTPSVADNKLRNSLNIPKGVPLIGFVGRLEYEKGPDLFLRIAEYIHRAKPEVHYLIAGDGSMGSQLRILAKQMRIDDKVHFVGWNTELTEIYQSLDLLVHSSRSDGTSLVLLEAMACALPIVGIGVGGVTEIIENESTGILAGAGDWESVGVLILQLLEDPDQLKSMGAAARQRLEKHFNVKTNTEKTAQVLRNLVNGGLNGHHFTNNVLARQMNTPV